MKGSEDLPALLQHVQEHELASIRTELRDNELSGPVPSETVTAATLVDAAKAGMEYRPREDGRSWVLVRKENRLMLRVNPAAMRARNSRKRRGC